MPLRDYQMPHCAALERALKKWRSALDASDAGLGKTYITLHLCKKWGIIPFVIGPKTARAGWEAASVDVGWDMEFISYGQLKGKRNRLVGGVTFDSIDVTAIGDHTQFENYECHVVATLQGRRVLREKCSWGEAHGTLQAAGIENPPMYEPCAFDFTVPVSIRQRLVADTDYVEEIPHGKGSYLSWKEPREFAVFDEVQHCGGSTSLNSKSLIAARRQFNFVLGLSATAVDDPRQMKALGFALGLHGLNRKTPPSKLTWMDWLLRHECHPGIFGGFGFTSNDEKSKAAFKKLNAEVFPEHGARLRKVEIPGFPKTTVNIKLLTDYTGRAKKAAQELHDLQAEDAVPQLQLIHGAREELEMLKMDHFAEMVEDYGQHSKMVFFVNYTNPREKLVGKLKKLMGSSRVGQLYGGQSDAERAQTLSAFQANKLDGLVANIKAGGEAANMHDPTGQVERTALISPCDSGRTFKQVLGRVNRDGAAYSLQLICYFKDTEEETVAQRMQRKGMNVDLFNDADCLV